MSDNPPTTLTVEQAAVVVGVGRSTAYEPVCSGDLKCIRLRRRIVVPVAHLAETLDVDRADVWSVISVDAPVTSSPARAAPSEQQPARRRAMATVETPTLF
ncbi:MAG: helix-turn-helix domain-containing protein [Microthrixaceae bacterium]|nr:helix-turn-helix domain-containing protein [Microthrixaceae bacterium]